MKDAVIFHPARTIGETAGAAVEMGQNEMVAEYKEPNYTVKVFRPILTDEEREKRFNEFKYATAKFMAAVYRERQKKAREEATA